MRKVIGRIVQGSILVGAILTLLAAALLGSLKPDVAALANNPPALGVSTGGTAALGTDTPLSPAAVTTSIPTMLPTILPTAGGQTASSAGSNHPSGLPLLGRAASDVQVNPVSNSGVAGAEISAAGSDALEVGATISGVADLRRDIGQPYGNVVYVFGYVDPASGLSYNTVSAKLLNITVTAGQEVQPGSSLGTGGSPLLYEVWQCQLPDAARAGGISTKTINRNVNCQPVNPQPYLPQR